MRLSQYLLDRIIAAMKALNKPSRVWEIAQRLPNYNAVTVRHGLRALVHQGKITFYGRDRHRLYYLHGTPVVIDEPPKSDSPKKEVLKTAQPNYRPKYVAMPFLGLLFSDVSADVLEQEAMAARRIRRTVRNVTARLMGDPQRAR